MARAVKFILSVHHPEGTTLNDNEVVYTVVPEKGGIGGDLDYTLVHRNLAEDGSLQDETRKRLWFSGRGAKDYGNAYFFALGARCTGVVMDAADAEVSNTVDYGTDPLP